MSIEQKADRFCGGDCSLSATLVNQFGDRRNSEVFSTAQLVALAHDGDIFNVD